MKEQQVYRRARLAAAATLAVLTAYVLFLTNPHYNLGDDAILLRAMGGAVGGVIDGFNDYTHTLLRRCIQGLTLLWPEAAWFSVAQVAILTISIWTTVASSILFAYRQKLPLWLGWLAGAGFSFIFLMPSASGVTFTLTAASAGCAAVWQLLAIDWRGASRRRELAKSLLLLALCLSMRREVVAPALVFWLGALLWRRLTGCCDTRRFLTAALSGVVLLAALTGIQAIENICSGEQAYLDWQVARSSAIDYGGFAAMTEEQILENGWTAKEVQLAQGWCFLDSGMTTEALTRAGEAADPYASASEILHVLQRLLTRSRNIFWAVLLLAGLCLTALLSQNRWTRLAALACGMAAAALLVYLAWKGRLPMRAAATVMFPACALGTALALPVFWQHRKGLARWLCAGAAMLLAVLMFFNARYAWNSTFNPSPKQTDFAHTRLEHYALEHPDELIIGTQKLGVSWQLFPDWSAGKPANLLLSYGGWNNHSAGYRAAFAAFGYKHDAFRILHFQDDPLRLATAQGEAPPEALMDVMEEQAGCAIEAVLCHQENGFDIYRFKKAI